MRFTTPRRLFGWTLLLFLFSISAAAQSAAFTYQGKLTDGVNPATGTYEIQFRPFDAVSAGTQTGATITSNSVAVAGGVFTVNLDFGSSPFTGAERGLEIAVKKTSETAYATLTPRQPLTSSPYSIRTLSAGSADSLSAACLTCVTDAQIDSVSGSKITGTVSSAATAVTATNNVLKSGNTMTGMLNLPPNGLVVGANQIIVAGGNVGIGTSNVTEKLNIDGNVTIPATGNYLDNTPKTQYLTIGAAAFISANPAVCQARIDDGFSSSQSNGLNSLWATGGAPGTVAYFVAAAQLPRDAVITGFQGQLIKNGGSLQSIVELYRSNSSGYLNNTAQLIATAATPTSGGVVWTVSASGINTAYNTVDNANYQYFIRSLGEQNTQNLRLLATRITYQRSKAD